VAALAAFASPANAHPHVFIDGGVDLVFGDENTLEALNVTWLYDEFETLYILSSYGITLNADGGIDEADQKELLLQRTNWPSDFDGSAHLSVAGEAVALQWPTDLSTEVVDGRLRMTFTRHLEAPLQAARFDVAFYESTYFFAFKITDAPQILGSAPECRAMVTPFEPDSQDRELQATLAMLSREETPADTQVGALFADRITVECGSRF